MSAWRGGSIVCSVAKEAFTDGDKPEGSEIKPCDYMGGKRAPGKGTSKSKGSNYMSGISVEH